MDLRLDRPAVAGPARRHQGSADAPEPSASLVRERLDGLQHRHSDGVPATTVRSTEHPCLHLQSGLADPAGGGRRAEPADDARNARQVEVRLRLRARSTSRGSVHVGQDGPLHDVVGPVLLPSREGQLGGAGQCRERSRQGLRLPRCRRGHRIRDSDLRLGPAVGRRAVRDPLPGMADPVPDHDRADAVHGQEVRPPAARFTV